MEKWFINMNRPGRRANCGFSYVELVIVVLVLGIMAAVAGPSCGRALARARVDSVARRMAADLEYARCYAMLNSKTCSVAFISSPGSYSMTGVPHPDHPYQSYAVALANLDSGVVFKTITFNSMTSIQFNDYGQPLVGSPAVPLTSGTVELQLGSELSVVTVNPSTGAVSGP